MAMTMRAHSMAMQESLSGYAFGSAFGRQLQSHGLTDSQVRRVKNESAATARSWGRDSLDGRGAF